MNDVRDLLPTSPSSSATIDLGHRATACLRDGRIECIRIPDPHGNTERAAYQCARLRFRDKRAQKAYQHQLHRLALSAHAVIPVDLAQDVEAVRAGWQADLARRAAINAAADDLRARLDTTPTTPDIDVFALADVVTA